MDSYELKEIELSNLKKAGYNPRKKLGKNDPQYKALRRSIEEFGMLDPIVWNKRTGTVIGGHQRLTVLEDLGYRTAPCFVVDLSPEQEKQANVRLNSVQGEWDYDKLAELLCGFTSDEVEAAAFDARDLQELYARESDVTEDAFDVDASLEKHGEPVTRPGELILLGEHRLLCGDATSPGDADRLFAGELADMVFTDPPYNVDYHGATDEKLSIMNDNMAEEDFRRFLKDSFSNMTAHLKKGGAVYVCHSDGKGAAFRETFVEAGLLLKQTLVWVKNTPVLGRQDYHWQHEPILYGWKPGAKHAWWADRKQSTVIKPDDVISVEPDDNGYLLTVNNGCEAVRIRVPAYEVVARTEGSTVWLENKPLRNDKHPTMKPVRLCGRAIKNSSRHGERVADFFGGSGSTLIAAEQLGRVCCMMEKDPRYCDVIVERWETLTGRSASRIG
ncbi:MAG: site-specific DNA-methyltransferase [Eubacteriales bacterium]|nr:site-specific DNA-methyltransferase [Eubacteriales bacterium]